MIKEIEKCLSVVNVVHSINALWVRRVALRGHGQAARSSAAYSGLFY